MVLKVAAQQTAQPHLNSGLNQSGALGKSKKSSDAQDGGREDVCPGVLV